MYYVSGVDGCGISYAVEFCQCGQRHLILLGDIVKGFAWPDSVDGVETLWGWGGNYQHWRGSSCGG